MTYKARTRFFAVPENPKFRCNFCSREFSTLDLRDEHEISVHMAQIDRMYEDYKGLIPSG